MTSHPWSRDGKPWSRLANTEMWRLGVIFKVKLLILQMIMFSPSKHPEITSTGDSLLILHCMMSFQNMQPQRRIMRMGSWGWKGRDSPPPPIPFVVILQQGPRLLEEKGLGQRARAETLVLLSLALELFTRLCFTPPKKYINDDKALCMASLPYCHLYLTEWELCRNQNFQVMSLWWRIQCKAAFIIELIRAVPPVRKSFFLDKWYISFISHDLLALFQYY